jgi:membrane protease YdiL (CAAX protease family)
MNSSWSGPGEESLSSPPASPPPEAQKLPENPPFSVVEVLRIGVLMFVVPMFLAPFFVILVHWFFYPRLSLTAVASKPWILLGSQLAWYGVIAWFLIDYAKSRFQQSLWKAVRWNWPRQAWPALVAIGLATLLVLQELERVRPPAKNKPFDQFFDRPMDAYAFAFLAIAFAPFMEELFFRGLLYPVLARRLGVGVGVLLTAFAFALIHVLEYKDWVPVLIIFLVGVVLTAVRATMKSVGASFIVHSIYNGIPIIYALIASRGFRDLHKLAQ